MGMLGRVTSGFLICTGLFAYSAAAGLIVHCFYDERVTVTRRKLLLLAIIALIPSVVMSILPTSTEYGVGTLALVFLPSFAVLMWGGRNSIPGHLLNLLRLIITEILLFLVSGTLVMKAMGVFGIAHSDDLDLLSFTVPFFICAGLYLGCVRKGITMRLRVQEKLLVWIYCITLIISMSDPSAAETQSLKKSLSFFSFLVLVSMPVFIYKSRQSAYFGELSAHNESFLEAQLAASRQYRESQEETRAFRHDIKNELTMLSALMREKKYGEAEEYLTDMLGSVSALSPKIVTGDDMLDSLISSKLADLEKRGIEVTVKGVIDGGLGWKPIDICSVFANAVDNAAEACEKLPEGARKYINITFRKTELQRIVTISNPTAESVNTEALEHGDYFTTKPDKQHHGCGIRNIRRTAEKYGGITTFSCKDGEFVMNLLLMKSAETQI